MTKNDKKRDILKAATGKFRDAGETLPKLEIASESGSSKRPEKIYPHVHFGVEALPEIKNWKVGQMYTLAIRVKQVSYEKSDRMSGRSREEARFEVHGVKAI